MGLDVTLYGYVVNVNELASHNSSGCGIYTVYVTLDLMLCIGSRLNYRSVSI